MVIRPPIENRFPSAESIKKGRFENKKEGCFRELTTIGDLFGSTELVTLAAASQASFEASKWREAFGSLA